VSEGKVVLRHGFFASCTAAKTAVRLRQAASVHFGPARCPRESPRPQVHPTENLSPTNAAGALNLRAAFGQCLKVRSRHFAGFRLRWLAWVIERRIKFVSQLATLIGYLFLVIHNQFNWWTKPMLPQTPKNVKRTQNDPLPANWTEPSRGPPCADVSADLSAVALAEAEAPSEGGSVSSASLQPRRRSPSATRLVVPGPISAFCFLLSTFCFTANTANTANGAFALPPQICETLLCMHETQYAELEAQRLLFKSARTPGSSVECRVPRERSSAPRPASPGRGTACRAVAERRRVDSGPASLAQVYPLKWPCERESAEKTGKNRKKIKKCSRRSSARSHSSRL